MLGAPYGSPELIRALVDGGAKVNARDIRGMTALMLAVASETQDVRVVKILLDAKTDVTAKDNMGDSALDWARKFGNPQVIRTLEAAEPKDKPRHRRRSVPATTRRRLQRAQCSSPLLCLSAPTRSISIRAHVSAATTRGRPPRLRNRRCRLHWFTRTASRGSRQALSPFSEPVSPRCCNSVAPVSMESLSVAG